ncbi:DUF6069 family protein [Amycolatopsis speibonae]|uniref:DUF6069 family protein n=1 Tax=Amycolatopsis speibonae TaxID=1450224 RepID=A0ABV7P0K8_9PSEU
MTATLAKSPAVATRLGLAALAAAAANAAIALAAGTLVSGGVRTGLAPVEFLPATVIGIVIGAIGWTLVARYAPKALRVVVPAALVLTWIPDLLLLNAGVTIGNVIALMLMHLVVATAVVTAMRPGVRRARGDDSAR